MYGVWIVSFEDDRALRAFLTKYENAIQDFLHKTYFEDALKTDYLKTTEAYAVLIS